MKNPSPAKTETTSDPLSPREIAEHRGRQASVSEILNKLFGTLAESSPDLWERRAFLMLVGLVYERLATNEIGIPTEELIALAKVLAENRRAETGARHAASATSQPDSSSQADASGESPNALPNAFGNILRQVYGLDFAAENPETTK